MAKQLKEKKLSFLPIPWAVRLLSDQILMNGLRTEGIGRVPGAGPVLKATIDAFDKGDWVNLNALELGPEEVMDTWKKYFRDLPSSLLPPEALLWDEKPEAEKLPFLKSILKSCPKENTALLKELFFVMHHVMLASHVNKMSTSNLATVIAMSEFLLLGDPQLRQQLSEYMIDEYHRIFDDIDTNPGDPSLPVPTTGSLVVLSEDGSVRSIMLPNPDADTVNHARAQIEKKTTLNVGDSWANWRIYAMRGRSSTLLDGSDHLLPLTVQGAVLYFTNRTPTPVDDLAKAQANKDCVDTTKSEDTEPDRLRDSS